MTGPRCIWQAGALLGEGPVWVAREAALYWLDIKGRRVHRLDPGSGARATWRVAAQISSLQPAARGGFVAATRDGFAFVDLNGGEVTLRALGGPEAELGGNRFNDGKVDAAGRFWAGSMDDGEQAATGVLYRLDSDETWSQLDSGYVITNGPAFSSDGRTLYHTETLRGVVYAFDLAADGSLANKRAHIRIPPADGHPDGMTVDSEGALWVAHYGGWRVTRFDPAGQEIDRIELPVANVTSCTFGGPDLDRLYITTAAQGLGEAALRAQPLAGGLFVCTPGARGLPGTLFGAPP